MSVGALDERVKLTCSSGWLTTITNFLTARFLPPERIDGVMRTFQSEIALTNHLGVLLDWYSLAERKFVYDTVNIHQLIFRAAEYCKDGLLPMTEVMGYGVWTERVRMAIIRGQLF